MPKEYKLSWHTKLKEDLGLSEAIGEHTLQQGVTSQQGEKATKVACAYFYNHVVYTVDITFVS